MARTLNHTWTWTFRSPVEAVWPVLADTVRFNEAAGLPKYEVEEIPRPDGSVRFIGRGRMGPVSIAWDDLPANWVENRWFRHRREFHGGPLRDLTATLRFRPEAGGGSSGRYTLAVTPANVLGRAILAAGFFAAVERVFTRLAGEADAFAEGKRAVAFEPRPAVLADGARGRAAALAAAVDASEHGHGLGHRIADYVLTRQEADLFTIRPLRLARLWDVPEREAIEACLEAARQGLLGLRWELLCPRCQGGKSAVESLDELPTGAHCPSCNVDFSRDYANNVELAFHPARAIRPVDGGQYCLFGPMSTPHVKAQLTVPPGDRVEEEADLEAGVYRLRTLEPGGEAVVEWAGGGFPEMTAEGDAVAAGPPAPPGRLIAVNRGPRPLTFVVEERRWMRDVLTAHRATALQAFRDLFSTDVLRPGDHVEIDRIALMFTDLRGSTALYGRIGDPSAYALVREHFAVLSKAIRECDGAVVKTIGDAVMGAFVNPADALRAAIRIQDEIESFNRTSGKEPVVIKLGLHVGRCITVTLNGRLDYYGATANLAARLEGRSHGGDVVLSQDVARDPAVAPLLAGLAAVAETADLKGIATPVPYLRIPAVALAARRAAAPRDREPG